MTWRKTALYWLVFAVLTVGVVMTSPREVSDAPVRKLVPRGTILEAFGDDLTRFVLRRGDLEVVAEQVEHRWKLREPVGGGVVPSDLFAALVANLADRDGSKVVSEEATDIELATFGFDEPRVTIDVTDASGAKARIELGNENPTRTAVYARRAGERKVYLAGLNVRYYSDLLVSAAFPNAKVHVDEPPVGLSREQLDRPELRGGASALEPDPSESEDPPGATPPAMPEDATPEDATPEDAMPEDAMPEDAMPAPAPSPDDDGATAEGTDRGDRSVAPDWDAEPAPELAPDDELDPGPGLGDELVPDPDLEAPDEPALAPAESPAPDPIPAAAT